MFRNLFSRAPNKGFTVAEVAVGIAVSGILVVTVTRFFNDSHRAYNLQERLADRDQNAQYVLKRVQERLMEVGAGLPDSGYSLVTPSESGFSIIVNLRGGTQSFYSDLSAQNDIPVDDESGFHGATGVLIVRNDKSLPVEPVDIDASYNINGFTNGLKKGAGGQDTLHLVAPKAFQTGDAMYAYSKEDYTLNGTNLSLGTMVLAENIETVTVNFLDSTGLPTSNWNQMRSAKLSVTARTQKPDPGYTGDGYRRVTLNSEVRMRNRP